MQPTIEYFYTPLSPFTYLGHPGLRAIVARAGALLRHRPFRIREVFAATGGVPPAERPPARQAYRLMELRRIAERHGLPINLSPKHFPTDDTLAAGMIIAAQDSGSGNASGAGSVDELAFRFMQAVWAEDKDIADPAVCAACAEAAGFDAAALVEAGRSPEMEETRGQNTREAITRGVFGAPSYVVGDEIFWGQDRLDYLERAILRA